MKTLNPLISIIIPTYNLENYISETIESVLDQQNYSNFEVLIVDDNSTDNTFNIITNYANQDSRIKIFINKRSKGASGARNTGLENAKGEWITFLDGDDLWDERILAIQMDVLKHHPDAKLITSDHYIMDVNGAKILKTEVDGVWKKYYSHANIIGELLCLNNPASCFLHDKPLTRTGTLLIKSELFKIVGYFDEELVKFEDWLLWIKLAKQVQYMVYIPKPLMIYRHRQGSLSRSDIATDLLWIVVLKQLLKSNDFREYKDLITRQLGFYILAETYFYRKNGQKLKAIRSAIDGILFDSKNPLSWKVFLATCFFK